MESPASTVAGEAMFARYAYPPNELGYCGPGDGQDLLEFAHLVANGSSAVPDQRTGGLDVTRRARAFDGAWPYLQHLARAAGTESAMDPHVVEAYWVGNDLLHSTDTLTFAETVTAAFGGQTGADWGALAGVDALGPVPHHSFHVFAIYPWVGILRRTGAERALEVLDRCRIRWGLVESVHGDTVVVQCQPLTWTGTALRLGAPRPEKARLTAGGRSLSAPPQPGQWVSLHWDWVCDLLSSMQLEALSEFTVRQLAITNRPT